MIRYTIKLSQEEVKELRSIINKGSHTSQTFRTAYILLNCDEGDYSEKFRIKKFIFRFICIPAKWIKSGRMIKLRLYGNIYFKT